MSPVTFGRCVTTVLTCMLAAGEKFRFTGRPLVMVLTVERRQSPHHAPAPNGISHTTVVVLLSGWS